MKESDSTHRLTLYLKASAIAVLIVALAPCVAFIVAQLFIDSDSDPDGRTTTGAMLSTLFFSVVVGMALAAIAVVRILKSERGSSAP